MKTTEHFNQLTEGEAERLAILIEECGEVIQAACKILRHGYDSNNKGQLAETNRQTLERELGDVSHAAARMETAADINPLVVRARAASKAERIAPYLHHQGAAELTDDQLKEKDAAQLALDIGRQVAKILGQRDRLRLALANVTKAAKSYRSDALGLAQDSETGEILDLSSGIATPADERWKSFWAPPDEGRDAHVLDAEAALSEIPCVTGTAL